MMLTSFAYQQDGHAFLSDVIPDCQKRPGAMTQPQECGMSAVITI